MLAVLAAFFCLLFFAAAKKSRCRPAQGQRLKHEGIARMPAQKQDQNHQKCARNNKRHKHAQPLSVAKATKNKTHKITTTQIYATLVTKRSGRLRPATTTQAF